MSERSLPGRLQDKVAIVTGTSRGIGLEIARRFVREGAQVVGVSRTIGAQPVAGVVHLRADVSDSEDVQRVVRTTADRFGRVDILVNNAAVELEATVEDTSVEDWDTVMAVNVRSVFLFAKYAMPHLRATRGTIVNVASVDGFWAEPGLAAYGTSKGAVLALTKALAIDHGPEGVRCNSICPSYVMTDMLEQFYDAQPDPAGARAQAEGVHALRRTSTPEDVANLAVWLSSEEASFATGQSFVLDGGLTAGRTFDLARLAAPPAERVRARGRSTP